MSGPLPLDLINATLVRRLAFPFRYVRCPNLKARLPRSFLPSPWVVFAIAFLSYFLVLSGIIYDVIVEPPSIGGTRDPNTGAYRPVAFLQYRVNGQYIIEGLSAGFFFGVGGLGVILLDKSQDSSTLKTNRYLLLVSGVLCTFVAYAICQLFIRMKIPVSCIERERERGLSSLSLSLFLLCVREGLGLFFLKKIEKKKGEEKWGRWYLVCDIFFCFIFCRSSMRFRILLYSFFPLLIDF